MKHCDAEQMAKHQKMIKDATNGLSKKHKRSSSGDKLFEMMSEGGKKIKHAVRRRRKNKRSNIRSNMDDINDYDQNLNAFNRLSNQYSSRRRSFHARRKRHSDGSILPQYIPINGYYPTEQLNIYDDYFNPLSNNNILWD